MRRAARKDETQSGIVSALRKAGVSVSVLNAKGVPDLLCGSRGRNYLLEVIGSSKDKRYRSTGGLSPDQVIWHQDWRGQKALVRTVPQAFRAVGLISWGSSSGWHRFRGSGSQIRVGTIGSLVSSLQRRS